MIKTMNFIKNKMEKAAMSVQNVLSSKKAEGYVDTGVKIIIAVVIGGVIPISTSTNSVEVSTPSSAAPLFPISTPRSVNSLITALNKS